jgi:Lon protease-like protein
MPQTRKGFPLFPLGIVLLPEEAVPLHIFEPRYRAMIGECLEHELEFGIVWLGGDGGLHDVGCAASIERVIERFDDGRLNILVRGTYPFRLLRRIEDYEYPAGDVELLGDDDEGTDADAGTGARERYADLVERVTDERPSGEALAALDAYGMVATVELPLEAKQALLEQRSERERLRQIEQLFASALERIERAEVVAERARGNGHVRG